jgi:hypothetical protein
MSGTNAFPPNKMTTEERLAEIGHILANGLVRVLGRKASQEAADGGENFVGSTANQSGHARPTTARKA